MPFTDDIYSAGGWTYLSCLPNLQLRGELQAGPLSIVHCLDSRVVAIASQAPLVAQLQTAFTSIWGDKLEPCFLIGKLEEMGGIKDLSSAVVDMRNMVAVCAVVSAVQVTVKTGNLGGTLYTDSFDYAPVTPRSDGKTILIQSAAVRNVVEIGSGFHISIDPEISRGHPMARPSVDVRLFEYLKRCWDLIHVRHRRSWELRALFRSLSYAYRAAKLPRGCDSQIYDWGINTSLWLASFECMLRPKSRRSDKTLIFDHLEKRSWVDPKLRRKSRVFVNGKSKPPRALNFIQRLYNDIRAARNDFLHGNDISNAALGDRRKVRRGLLAQAAPLVFKVAAEEFCEMISPRGTPDYTDIMWGDELERALLAFKKPVR